jgi:hypothetical protein
MSWKSKTVATVLFLLVAIGLFSQLNSDPWGLIKSLAIAAVFAGILYFAVTRLSRANTGSSTDAGYQKALRQQKNRLKNSSSQHSLQPSNSGKLKQMNKLKASRRNHPFRVIEGKKNKPKTNETKTS